MNQKQRIATQRSLTQEALGKLRAASELFSVEDECDAHTEAHRRAADDYARFDEKVREFEEWLWNESPIA